MRLSSSNFSSPTGPLFTAPTSHFRHVPFQFHTSLSRKWDCVSCEIIFGRLELHARMCRGNKVIEGELSGLAVISCYFSCYWWITSTAVKSIYIYILSLIPYKMSRYSSWPSVTVTDMTAWSHSMISNAITQQLSVLSCNLFLVLRDVLKTS